MAAFARYAPNFTITLNGDPIPQAMRACITRLNYQDGLDGADRVEVILANESLRWLDHPLLQVDTEFRLEIGYAPNPLHEVFVGEITGVNATFPAGGMPTLTIVAHDFLQRLARSTKDRAFAMNIPCIGTFPLPDPYVAMLVSATNLLIPAMDPIGAAVSFLTLLIAYAIDPLEAQRSIRLQTAQSDFDFLGQVAKENGWEMSIDHTQAPRGYVLRFQFLLRDYSANMTLKWGDSLIDFTPKITTVGQVAAVSTRIWIPSIKMEFVVTLGWDWDRAAFDLQIYPGIGNFDALASTGKKTSTLRIDALGPAVAPKTLVSELLPRLNNRLTASGSTVGDPRIRSGIVIDFDGLGDEFGGRYRVTNATHTFDGSGYKTSFDVRKEVWFNSIPKPKGIAQLARVQGMAFH